MSSHTVVISDAEQAAKIAVKEVFFLLGVDVDNAESVESFREDLRFGRRLRKLANQGMAGLIGICALGLATALWSGIVALTKK